MQHLWSSVSSLDEWLFAGETLRDDTVDESTEEQAWADSWLNYNGKYSKEGFDMVPLPRAMWKIKRVHLDFLRAFTEKLTAWRENSKSNLTRKPDIGFSNEI